MGFFLRVSQMAPVNRAGALDGIGGLNSAVVPERFHFDEDQRFAVEGDQIQLADRAGVVAGQNSIALFFQVSACQRFAAPGQGFLGAVSVHRAAREKCGCSGGPDIQSDSGAWWRSCTECENPRRP